MKELIRIKEENGKKLVSARELYEGLGLNKREWSRWHKRNIENNEYFTEDADWVGFGVMTNGNQTKDFAISLEFAKHIAMMARTEKSHLYRNYFIECEKVVNNAFMNLSPEVKAIFELDIKQQAIKAEMDSTRRGFKEFKEDIPLFNIECDELQKALKKKGIGILGGYKSPAYNDGSLRSRVYIDIQNQIKREFGVHSYKAIKRKQIEVAKEIIEDYKAPLCISDEIYCLNAQINIDEVV